MRLLLIRHGQTPGNVLGQLDTAFPGPGLTGLGERQAAALPEALADEDIEAIQASLAEGYRQLFAVGMSGAGTAPASTGPAASAPSFLRFQAAAARCAELMSVIAQDAAGRLARALQEAGPDAPPITSLAGLRALWIDCGEAAYAEAARQEGFAAAQAELLMATAELTASA